MVMVIAVIPQKLLGAPKSTNSHCVHNFALSLDLLKYIQ